MPKIAILVEKEFEDLEVYYPFLRLHPEGYEIDILAMEAKKEYTGKWGYPIECDISIKEAKPEDYDGIIIPGGNSPDYQRIIPEFLGFTRKMDELNKLIVSICHGPWVMISAKIMKNRKCTSYVAIKDDLENAGAIWEDSAVVVDNNMITSRTPMDLEPMCKAILNYFKNQ